MTVRDRRSSAPVSVPPIAPGSVRHSPGFTRALSALLDFAISAPTEAGTRAVCRVALDCLHSLLPDLAVGLKMATQGGLHGFTERVWPAFATDVDPQPHRLFPTLQHERVLSLGQALQGSTLHVAGDGDSIVEEDSLERVIIDRAAHVIGPVIARSYANSHDHDASQHIANLRAQLIQAQKLASLGQTVAGVVHELSNPLTSILGNVQIAEHQSDGTERSKRLAMIADAAERMLRLSRGVVAYSRPAEQAMAPVDMREVTNTAMALVSHAVAGTEIRLECRLEAPSHSVLGRQGPLTQVFVNLLSNAVHAMQHRTGEIEVRSSTTVDGQRLVLEVSDQGAGIATEDLGRIFDAFFTTKGRGQGTGLGLAIVRDIVEHHGGTIRAVSTLGEGSTFTIVLPLTRGRIPMNAVVG